MPPHPMFQKQKPSLGWMPSRRNATGSCMQRSAKTCGKPLNLSCRQERDVRSSVSMMVSAPYCVLKSLYAGKRATERERKRTNVCCCCAKERVSVFWKRLMKTYPINPYYSECAWVPALARRPGILRTRFALKPVPVCAKCMYCLASYAFCHIHAYVCMLYAFCRSAGELLYISFVQCVFACFECTYIHKFSFRTRMRAHELSLTSHSSARTRGLVRCSLQDRYSLKYVRA